MSTIFGMVGLNDTDYVFGKTEGQRIVYDATKDYLMRANESLNDAMRVFVGETTELYKERYKLPGGGRLQRRGGQTYSGAVKASGSWDVAYPLEDFGAQIAGDDVSWAYMDGRAYQQHIDTVVIQNANTVRHEILKRLFNNTATSFADDNWGTLTIQPLAGAADGTLYPPVIGSDTEATEDHYLESGYAANAISDTNNPLITIRDEIEEHFGAMTGGENIVVFINNAQTAKISALSDFTEFVDRFVRAGNNTDVPTNLPGVPGRIIGRGSGVWVSEWRYIPANYMLGVHLEAPAPLKMRVDPAATGLGRGLQMVKKDDDFPVSSSHWRNRFGIGTANRLNGLAFELGTGGTYTIPTAFQ